jgi:hypothetical protein
MKKTKDSFFPGKAWNQSKINDCWFKEPYKKAIRGLVGHPLYAETLLQLKNKSVVYSFNKINNIYPLLNKTEYLLKSLFLSTYSLISRPVYLIKHDKIIIRLFVFLSPKVEKYLDTSLIGQGGKLQGASPSIFYRKRLVAGKQFLIKFLKFKSFRPKTVNILKNQIQLNSSANVAAPTVIATATNTAAVKSSKAGSKKITFKPLEQIVKKILSPEPIFRSGAIVPEGEIFNGSNSDLAKHAIGISSPSANNPYISFVSHFKKILDRLSIIFSQILKKRVEFEIIKAQLPFQDSHLLAQILGYNANNYQFRKMLKILTPRAVIKNPSKELGSASLSQHKQMFGIGSSAIELGLTEELGLRAKDMNILFSQPNSYLPPFFYSKFYLKWINRFLFSSYRPAKQLAPCKAAPAFLAAAPQVKGAESAMLINNLATCRRLVDKTKKDLLR